MEDQYATDSDIIDPIKIAENINENIKDIVNEDINMIVTEKPTKTTEIKRPIYYDLFIEGLIFLIVYLILSQDVIKNFIGQYITAINKNKNTVNLIGQIIYGFITFFCFILMRYLVLTYLAKFKT